jgi:hypothetical protein
MFDIREEPLLDIEHDSFGAGVRQLIPKFLAGIDELYGEVRAQSTCQGPPHSGIFFENDYALTHKIPRSENRRQRHGKRFD